MYTITLANGAKLTGLDMNGTNYVSKEKVDETIFKDNLSTCSDSRWSSWGNGADRVNRLKQAGYDPNEVQSEVNKLF